MATPIGALFERELERRRILFTKSSQAGRYSVHAGGTSLAVDLENLAREYKIDHDADCVPRFLDAILERDSGAMLDWNQARESVLFGLEPNDYAESSDLRAPISRRVDRVPILIHRRLGAWQWIMRDMLEGWGISMNDLAEVAFANLAAAAASSTVECAEIDGVTLGYFETSLLLKSSILLAPNLREIVAPIIGWPLHAVVPDQDFVYVWPADHEQFYERVGAIVVREYSTAPHPVTTELFTIGDDGIRAVGAFA
jgi:hypothetical protein